MPNVCAEMERSAFAKGGTALALQGYPEDTTAAPAASYSNVSGGHAMPSRRNDQEHPVDEQPVDAIALLKEDHQRVKDLFAQYEGTSNAEAKWTLAEEIFVELETHAQLEENIFYPSVNEETEEGPALVKESLQEHATVKQLIAELRQMGPQNNRFDAKFHEMMHNVEHHVAEEEAEMFPLAEEELAEDLDEMSAEMQELKKEILAS
jgi:hemerythrin-like domain-containing protein